ncbi:hypothetical protein FCV25MIE_04316 [Fagus crenata]
MYDENPSFDIILHHGGFFTVKDKLRVYLGGQECFLKKNDPDKWSVFELHDNCKELDVCNVIQFYYCTPGINLNDGLNYLRTDDDTRRFLEYAFIAPKNVIHVYVEHEEVAPLDMISGLVPMLKCNQAEGNEDDVDDVDDRDEDMDGCLDKKTTSEMLKYFEEDYVWLVEELNLGHTNQSTPNPTDTNHVNPTTQENLIAEEHVNPTTQDEIIVEDNINPTVLTTQENPIVLCGEEFEDIPDGVSDYGDSDVLSTPPNSEDENPKKKYPEFHAATDMSNPEFKIGMIFSDNKELKEAIRAYKIKWGFPLKFKKNEPKRVRVICAEGCDWRMHAIWKKDSNSFQIIKLVKEHSCAKAFHSRQVTSKWVARVFLEKFRLDPNMALLKIKAGILEQYEVEISMCKAYRARQIANEMINGRFEDNYLRIRDYYEELKVSNLDQQKGLKQALEEVIPEAPTRFCLRHLYANFKNKFKGKALKDLMWAAAKETTEVGFNAKMDQIKVLNKDAYGHLKGIEAEHWSKHKFSQIPKCDMQLNNLCEVFNSKIVEARDKPILTMCEMIRKYLMTRIVKNGEQMANYRGPICPRAQDKLQLNKVEGRDSRTTVCGGNKFEINLHGKQYKVDLERQTCSCFKWELTGIPCCHGVVAILHKKLKPENYVNACYHTSTYLRIYSHLLLPTNGSELWPKALGSIVLPPIFKKQPGRPNKQKRRKDIDEVQNPYKMKKAGYAQKCSLCHQVGHKKQSCKYGQSAGEAHSNPLKGKGKSKATQGRKRQKSGAGHTYDFMGFRLPVDDMII